MTTKINKIEKRGRLQVQSLTAVLGTTLGRAWDAQGKAGVAITEPASQETSRLLAAHVS